MNEKKTLSAKGLLNTVKNVFSKIKENKLPVDKAVRGSSIPLVDCLMSGLAIFKLKFPSLLQFDQARIEDETIRANLKSLFQVSRAPSDTQMRERLDEVNPRSIRKAFNAVFTSFQRGKGLEKYCYIENKYLANVDGTGLFSSNKVHCPHCCEKHHKNGKITYHHQMLSIAISHPDQKEVIPLCPEPILKSDGAKKNDCERNASERLLRDLRREHPHLPLIIVEDALSANAPHIRLLNDLKLSFIIGVKPDGNSSLFEFLKGINFPEYSFIDERGRTHRVRWAEEVPINNANSDLLVNYVEYWEYNSKGQQTYHNTWITDLKVTKSTVYKIALGGRNRWTIENETFNTLKNQGYHFEHNFGHGKKNLCSVFGLLMLLAFLIDQVEQACCGLFQAAWAKMKSKIRLWERIRAIFSLIEMDCWSDLYALIIRGSRCCCARELIDSS